ncbi:MAG TPA: hypothetical protein DEG17_15655 [Cyanobacteria bacterium UBA11149]|nr:hypothetical protein [Cyanobacteria bacterium UBA11367]HBE60790.1 hypothetical protein [Cyanobacteria bacterium UBA11366]HBK66423.1 hypothetical protein [Cyanobacteria bacterium UBA11166]HBR73644.1 hypothetical protein [Cyanobacteria bacterium UBA11159]HBS72195.1 hypothetical protein [Cyanobacteria bacterium UBA11153]HBW90267.1 hypothetical protein [Cyanobacteria bacterium UBA11149]HCA98201.1 hypothetical protein [Cyanobacteria bacterium UBA9226]
MLEALNREWGKRVLIFNGNVNTIAFSSSQADRNIPNPTIRISILAPFEAWRWEIIIIPQTSLALNSPVIRLDLSNQL